VKKKSPQTGLFSFISGPKLNSIKIQQKKFHSKKSRFGGKIEETKDRLRRKMVDHLIEVLKQEVAEMT
jgi:starvation-inducible outer membrane lipoprotein